MKKGAPVGIEEAIFSVQATGFRKKLEDESHTVVHNRKTKCTFNNRKLKYFPRVACSAMPALSNPC
jgi:hypothetical protein